MNKPIHPAVAEHVIEENEKLRGLLRDVRVLLANSSYKISGSAAFLRSIDAALSQQAEPCEFHESEQAACRQYSGQVPCEPAPAQGEREAVEVVAWLREWKASNRGGIDAGLSKTSLDGLRKSLGADAQIVSDEPLMTVTQHERIVAALTRPAQIEQQPIRLPQRADTSHGDAFDTQLAEAYNTALDEVARMNAAPIAQTAAQPSKAIAYRTLDRYGNPVTDWIDGDPAGGDPIVSGGSFQLAYGAPQPEQSGLYTCIGKGGAYELIGRATTAGVLKVTGRFADEVIVYRDTESNALYCREPGDFQLRMARSALSAQGTKP